MAKYAFANQEGTIILREDGAFIPVAEGNNDYAEYLAWVEEGNVTDPWVKPPGQEEAEQADLFKKALIAEAKADPVFAKVKDLTPDKYDDFVHCMFPRMSAAQQKVIRFLLLAAVIVVRD